MNIPIGTVLKRKLLGVPIGEHYGVVVGYNGFHPLVLEKTKVGTIEPVYLSEFACGQEVVAEVNPLEHPLVVRARAEQARWKPKPWAPWDNCEHLARNVALGKNESYQFQFSVVACVILAVLMS